MNNKENILNNENKKKNESFFGKCLDVVQSGINSMKTFFLDTIEELKRCSWPNRSELTQSTVLVIVMTFAMSFFSGVVVWLGGICLL